MKTKYLLGLAFACASTCYAQQTLREYDWQKLLTSGELLGGTPVTIDGRAALKVNSTNDAGLRVQLTRITNPPVSKMVYAIMGEVKYEGVKGDGFLEMWNCFPPQKPGMVENQYFSRTLGESGELGKITGTSNWRPFMLPFDRTGSTDKPTRLEINIVLPSQGTIYLGAIKLVEYEGELGLQKSGGARGAWWSDRAAGWIGGIGGIVLGCLGSVLAMLAAKGKSRGFVVVTCTVLIAVGFVLTFAGIWALSVGQPYAVWFPLLLIGIILEVVLATRLRHYKKSYEELEMRRMASMDA
jgi:hypothetical protein